jgi:biotin carboxyl carrier protein
MRFLAQHGDQEVEAQVKRDGDKVTIQIGETEHVFRIVGHDNGRLELELQDGTAHVVEIVGTDLRVDGAAFPLDLRKAPPLVPGAMKGGGGAGGSAQVKPPMPGKIVKVAVAPGDHVQPGEVLVILEAMKMQNEIVAPRAGTVTTLSASPGQTVLLNELLAEIS